MTVSSAGTSAWDDAPASDGAMLVAMEHGLDLSAHRARMLSPEVLGAADLVLVMGPHHVERVLALGGEGRTHLLHEFATSGESRAPVVDPFGGDLETYRMTFRELEGAVTATISRLIAERQA
jgi:protein-tyrosine-phosphatase